MPKEKTTPPNTEGKREGDPTPTPTVNAQGSTEALQKEIENLKGTQAALTKKLAESENVAKTFLDKLAALVGPEKAQKPEDALAALADKVASLEQEANKGKFTQALRQVVTGIRDENGNPLDDKVQEYLLKDVVVDSLDPEVIKQAVLNKIEAIRPLFETGSIPDSRPPGSSVVPDPTRAPSANEVLKGIGTGK